MNAIVAISGTKIRNGNGLYSLNDLHKASGGQQKHKPSNWLANKQTTEIIKEIEIAGIPAIQSKQGLGTFVCKELVIHYGMWISPEFSLKVIRTFLEVEQAKAETITPEQKAMIQKAVNARHNRTGEHWQLIYTNLHQYCQVNSYHEIKPADFDKAMQYIYGTPHMPATFRQPEQKEFYVPDDVLANVYRVLMWSQRMRLMYEHLYAPMKTLGSPYASEIYDYGHELDHTFSMCQRSFVPLFDRMKDPAAIKTASHCLQRLM